MRRPSPLEKLIHNKGERLVPGESHDLAELVRHRSTYLFFREIIEQDLLDSPQGLDQHTRILDLGCGVGHGCRILARIPGAEVLGIDSSPHCIAYARRNHPGPNLDYLAADIRTRLRELDEFDYIVSRGTLEHLPDGLEIIPKLKWKRRLMLQVPFNEPESANPHHRLHSLGPQSFAMLENPEFFYEDLQGATHDNPNASPPINIICAASRPPLPPAASSLDFPRPPWTPLELEAMLAELNEYNNRLELLNFELQKRQDQLEKELHHRMTALRNKLLALAGLAALLGWLAGRG